MYWSVEEVGGWANYLGLTLLYLSMVEMGVYWMHRTLHTNKWSVARDDQSRPFSSYRSNEASI